MMTQTEFINKEISVWGEDYIFDLLDKGYEPVLTDAGWYWILTSPVTGVDTAPDLCYADGSYASLPLA